MEVPGHKTILIVDDNIVNRKMLNRILSTDYNILEAENGQTALEILRRSTNQISGVMLDLVMPVMDGYAFLQAISHMEDMKNLPVIVITGNGDQQSEARALASGAWDFVSKPYNTQIIRFRLKNAIDRSQLSALTQLKYQAEFDTLTDLYNKNKFCARTQEVIAKNKTRKFLLVRLDIDRFQLVNSYFGVQEGDRLLRYLANELKEFAIQYPPCTLGRMEADIFAFCCPCAGQQDSLDILAQIQKRIKAYNIAFDIVITFGLYFVDDTDMPVSQMLDRANLAAKKAKGNYINNYAFYTEEMGLAIQREQDVINDMNTALAQKQFRIYIQPKYSLQSNLPVGGEALVRWQHPAKGMIPPSLFIPVFEKNGFISQLDFFVWNQVCRLLRKWLDEGMRPHPISVNVSRVNLYNPNIVEIFCKLIQKYGLSPALLQLELTESAYTDNAQVMKKVIQQLRGKGFSILMDDFGSGYSSLNILKDIEVDALKIDMQFLSETSIAGRGENIIASVVRMAKWLGIPTIAEGAERLEQVEFLRGIGCEYVQGFYFGRPMTADAYREVVKSNVAFEEESPESFDMDALWTSNPQMEMLFSNALQAAAIFEFDGNKLEQLRVNKAYAELFGYDDIAMNSSDTLAPVVMEYRSVVLNTCKIAVETRDVADCDYLRHASDGKPQWVNLKIKYISSVANKHVLLGSLFDVTAQKEIESELYRYRNALLEGQQATNRLLVVDDSETDRMVVRSIFKKQFQILEAENGQQGLDLLKQNGNRVDIILLDMMMPVMDGSEFLARKRLDKDIANIPVVIITADETKEQQINTLALGANDYIVKPLVKEIVLHRVGNVLESNRRFRVMLQEYQNAIDQAKEDPLTHVYNRAAAEETVTKVLREGHLKSHALIMIDVDGYKGINDMYGHSYGDMVLVELANEMSAFFMAGDMVARMGGDEFCVLMVDIQSAEATLQKCGEFCKAVEKMNFGSEHIRITCSAGIAISKPGSTFDSLYKEADSAMYESKNQGKNRATLFDEQNVGMTAAQWVNREWLIDSLDDAVFIVDAETDDVLYASRAGMRLYHTESFDGKKCYELFAQSDSLCKDCIKQKLTYERFFEWIQKSPAIGKTLVLRDKFVNYSGRKAHLRVAMDITNLNLQTQRTQ